MQRLWLAGQTHEWCGSRLSVRNLQTVARIWDVFLSEGLTALHAVGLAVLKLNEDTVRTLSSDTLETVVDHVREWMSQRHDPSELLQVLRHGLLLLLLLIVLIVIIIVAVW